MITLALLSAVMQCSGGSCATYTTTWPNQNAYYSSFGGWGPYYAQAVSGTILPTFQVVGQPATVQPDRKETRRSVDGHLFDVWLDSSGRVTRWYYQETGTMAPPLARPKPTANPQTAPVGPSGPAPSKTQGEPQSPARDVSGPVLGDVKYNGGIDLSKTFNLPNPNSERYISDGPLSQAFAEDVKAWSRAYSQGQVQAAGLADDSAKPFVTALSENKQVREETKKRLGSVLGDTAHVAVYDPKNPLVDGLKFWRGQDEIVIQQAADPNTGRSPVVDRIPITASDQQIIAARRKADPAYDPNSSADGVEVPDAAFWGVLALVALGVVFLGGSNSTD